MAMLTEYEEFQALSSMVALVTAIHNPDDLSRVPAVTPFNLDPHGRFCYQDQSMDQEGEDQGSEGSESITARLKRALNALATVTVRDHEVVASTVAEEENLANSFTVISNTRYDDTYFQDSPDLDIQVLTDHRGSFWDEMQWDISAFIAK